MFGLIVIMWILFHLKAPVWCFVLIVTSMAIKIFSFGANMYKRVMEQAESEE